jgi:phosphoglycolate phosphatase
MRWETLQPHLAGKTLVLWDFNGTLLDDVTLCVEIQNEILAACDGPPLTRERYLEIFRFPVTDYYADLGVNPRHYATLSPRFPEIYWTRFREASVFPGTHELIERMTRAGIQSAILSAAEERYLREAVASLNLAIPRDRVFGISDHRALGKVERGKEIFTSLGVSPDSALMIGDTDHDVEVARALQIDVVLLEGGHQCLSRLKATGAKILSRG